jgi:hypothetical protein
MIFIATPVLLFGCGRHSELNAGDADIGDRAAQRVVGREIVRFDGFEGDSVASFWRPANAGDGRYEPGAIGVSAEYARTGAKSVRITVREGDIEQTGDDGKQTERAELDSGRHAFVGRDVWYGFTDDHLLRQLRTRRQLRGSRSGAVRQAAADNRRTTSEKTAVFLR